MKILIIHNHYLEKGGEDEAVSSEARLLEEHGHRVILYEKSNEDIKNWPFFKKFIFILLELNFSMAVYKELKEIIKKENPDIAHIHNTFFRITPAVYFALKQERIPVIQSLHNYRFFCLRGTFFNKGEVCEKCKGKKFHKAVAGKCWRGSFILSYFLARLLYKADSFLKKIDSYIALSNFSRDKFIELGLDKQRIHLKPNLLKIEPVENNQDGHYALFVGRLVDYKGVRTLIRAFKENPFFNLKIVGDGPLNPEVSALAVSNSKVEWLGQLERELVFEVIKNSSFLIFPSECFETMGMTILEGFAFSKPVLASNRGAAKDLVVDGVNGILFEPGNPIDLAAKISYLFSHDQERIEMSKNAYRFYRERFNRENNYRDLMDIYRKAVNAKSENGVINVQ